MESHEGPSIKRANRRNHFRDGLVLWMRDEAGCSFREIAESVKVSPPRARQLYIRARSDSLPRDKGTVMALSTRARTILRNRFGLSDNATRLDVAGVWPVLREGAKWRSCGDERPIKNLGKKTLSEIGSWLASGDA